MSVERVRVGEVLALQRREVVIDPMNEYRLIGVYSFGKGIFHRDPRRGSELGNYRYFAIEPGDLVLSNIQAWEGAIGFARAEDARTIGTHRFLSYVPIAKRIDTNWARWFFLSEPGMKLIRQAAPGTTIRNRTLAIDRFEATEIPLPVIDEQRRTAERLDRLQAATTQLAHGSRHASQLLDAFTVSASARPDLNEEAKARTGWRPVTLGDVVSPSSRQVDVDPMRTYHVAGVYSFGRGLIDRGAIGGTDTAYKTLTQLATGDIIVSKLGGWEGAVTVVDPRFEGFSVSSEFLVFEPDADQLIPGFFRGITRSPSFWGALDLNTRGSMARRRRITPSLFLGLKIWLPPTDTQIRVAEELERVDRVRRAQDSAQVRIGSLTAAAVNEAFATIS